MTCCSEFPTPLSRCHSSCAGRRPAGPARGWLWRRSLADGGAKEKKKKKGREDNKMKLFGQECFDGALETAPAGRAATVTAPNYTIKAYCMIFFSLFYSFADHIKFTLQKSENNIKY